MSKEDLTLLKKYGIKGEILKHSLGVNKIAIFLARKFKEKGFNINISLVNSASLLHDIGRLKADLTKKHHAEEGYNILIKENAPKIAEIVKKHALDSILRNELKTLEEKIVYYADKRFDSKLVSLDERFKGLIQRHLKHKEEILKAIGKIKKLEKEIFGILKISNELKKIK